MCVRAAALVLASRTVAILRRAIRAEAIVPERSLILDRGPDIETDLVHVCAEHRDLDRVEQCRLRSEEHTSELQSLMRISYAVFCLKKKKTIQINTIN